MIWYILSAICTIIIFHTLLGKTNKKDAFNEVMAISLACLIAILGFALCTLVSMVEMDNIISQSDIYDNYKKVDTLPYDNFSYAVGEDNVPFIVIESIKGNETVVTAMPVKTCRILKGKPRIEKYEPIESFKWTFMCHLEYPDLYTIYIES